MRRIVQRRIRHEGDGVSVAADVNAVVSTNTGTGARTTTGGRQRVQIVQRRGRNEDSRKSGE